MACPPAKAGSDGAQQQPLEPGAEFGSAALHGVARIAQQTRQTHLRQHGMAALPRLGWIPCSTASVPANTPSHQVVPPTRAEVSSEHTTGLAGTPAWIAAAGRGRPPGTLPLQDLSDGAQCGCQSAAWAGHPGNVG